MKNKSIVLEELFKDSKTGNYRMWKSGKTWLYGGITLASLAVVSVGISYGIARVSAEEVPYSKVVPFAMGDIPVEPDAAPRATVAATRGFVKWTSSTTLKALSGQSVIPSGDIDPTWQSWLGSNHVVYEMRKGDKFLLSNVTKDDDGQLVSVIVTVRDLGPQVTPSLSIDKKNSRPTIIIEDGGITTVTAKNGKKLTSEHSLHLFYSSTPAPILDYQFVKASDNKTPVEVTAQSTYFDIDASQSMKTDLFPTVTTQLYLPSTNEGKKTLTFDVTKRTLYANYSGNVENIGDGSGFTNNGKTIDNYGAGFAQSKNYWTGDHFSMQFANNASVIDSSLNNIVPPIDKQLGLSKTYKQIFDENNAKKTRGTFRHELFGQTTSNMFAPQGPEAPDVPQNPDTGKAPDVPVKQDLPTAPTVPQLEQIKDAAIPPKLEVLPTNPDVPTLEKIDEAPKNIATPELPIEPSAPEEPKLPDTPVAPELSDHSVTLPELPPAPTLKSLDSVGSLPTKLVTDNSGNNLDGQSIATNFMFNFTISQKIDGRGNEFSNFKAFLKAHQLWKNKCVQMISDYKADLTKKQEGWDSDHKKALDYLSDYQTYVNNFTAIVKQYDTDFSKYEAQHKAYVEDYQQIISNYNDTWSAFSSQFLVYLSQYDKKSSEYESAWQEFLVKYNSYSSSYDKIVGEFNKNWEAYIVAQKAYSDDYDSKISSYTGAWESYDSNYQSYSTGYDSIVSNYELAWSQYEAAYNSYSLNYDKAVNQFNVDWQEYTKKYTNYHALWTDYDNAYKQYKAAGGNEAEITLEKQATKPTFEAKVEKAEKVKFASKTSQENEEEIPQKVPEATKPVIPEKTQLSSKEEIPEKAEEPKKANFPEVGKAQSKVNLPDLTPAADTSMKDRPEEKEIKIPDSPSLKAEDYIYTQFIMKDSIDLTKVNLAEGTTSISVIDQEGKPVNAVIKREDTNNKANIEVIFDKDFVQSDAFYNNEYKIFINGAEFNIDNQTQTATNMTVQNVASVDVPTPTVDPDEPSKNNIQFTNEVSVIPEYNQTSILKEQSLDGKNWTIDPLNLPEHDNTWQERITHQLSNHADYKTIILKDKWETVKHYESMKVTNSAGKEIEGTTEILNAAGKDVSREFKAGTLQKDGKKEQVTILFHVKNPEQFTRAQGDALKLYMTFTGVTTKGASGQEEVNYLDKDDSIKLPDTASAEWTDKTPEDGDKGKVSQISNTVIDVLPKLDPNLRKFVVTKQEGKHETVLDSKGKYKPDYIKDAVTTDGDTLVAQKEIKNGEQVTWAIVGTPGNQGVMTQLVDTLPNEFSFDPSSKTAFTAYVLKNDGTLGEEITDHFDYQIKDRVVTVTPTSAADFLFVGSSTDSRYVILVNTIANENISDGIEFVNHANQTTVNPNNPDHPKDTPSDAKVITPKQKGTLPLTGSQFRGILTVIGLIMMSVAGVAVFGGKKFKKSEDKDGTSDSTVK